MSTFKCVIFDVDFFFSHFFVFQMVGTTLQSYVPAIFLPRRGAIVVVYCWCGGYYYRSRLCRYILLCMYLPSAECIITLDRDDSIHLMSTYKSLLVDPVCAACRVYQESFTVSYIKWKTNLNAANTRSQNSPLKLSRFPNFEVSSSTTRLCACE